MFIAHLPAAYIGFKLITPRLPKTAFVAGMLGSIAPDIDLLWLYFADAVPNHHHDYITHRPAFWLVLLGIGLISQRFERSNRSISVITFACGALLHMCLDTIAGKIAWGWPFSDFSDPFVVVPASHSNWILSFLTHSTFSVEIAITAVAALLFMRNSLKS